MTSQHITLQRITFQHITRYDITSYHNLALYATQYTQSGGMNFIQHSRSRNTSCTYAQNTRESAISQRRVTITKYHWLHCWEATGSHDEKENKKRKKRSEEREETRRDEKAQKRREREEERKEKRRGVRQQRTCAAVCMSAPAAISAMAMSVCPLQQAFIKAVSPA